MEKYFRSGTFDRCLDMVSVEDFGNRVLLSVRDNNETKVVKMLSLEAAQALRDVLNSYFEGKENA